MTSECATATATASKLLEQACRAQLACFTRMRQVSCMGPRYAGVGAGFAGMCTVSTQPCGMQRLLATAEVVLMPLPWRVLLLRRARRPRWVSAAAHARVYHEALARLQPHEARGASHALPAHTAHHHAAARPRHARSLLRRKRKAKRGGAAPLLLANSSVSVSDEGAGSAGPAMHAARPGAAWSSGTASLAQLLSGSGERGMPRTGEGAGDGSSEDDELLLPPGVPQG